MRNMKCPNCSASLTIQDDNRDFAFCEYCGSKILLDDYRSTHRIVDEAKIKQAEIDKMIQLKKLELLEKEQNAKQSNTIMKMIFSFFIMGGTLIAGFIVDGMMFMLLLIELPIILMIFITDSELGKSNKMNNTVPNGMAMVPSNIVGYKNMDYTMVAQLLEESGFNNIQYIPMQDTVFGIVKNIGHVDRLFINNELIISGGGFYPANSKVEIYYHSSKIFV